jgi:hypothetical protein
MRSQKPRPQNLISTFGTYTATAESVEAIHSFLALASKPPRNAYIRQQLLFGEGDLAAAIEDRASWLYFELQRTNPDIPVYSLRAEVGRTRLLTLKGSIAILPGSKPGLHRLVTVSYSPFWNRVALRLSRHLYPDAIPAFFKQDEIKRALLSLQSGLASNTFMRISEVTMKRKRAPAELATFRRFETDRLWTELSVADVFAQAVERNQWFSSLQFAVEKRLLDSRQIGRLATVRIHKKGHLAYDALHTELSASLVSALEEFVFERISLLKGRGLRERNYTPGRPIEITFPGEVFASADAVRRFGEVIASYPNSTRAVYHSNPYYHASVADFLDGSSFELWVLSSSRVMILPQAKSSEEAFQRLIGHIFFEFREGVIGEYSG